MSLLAHADDELRRAGWDDDDREVMVAILKQFFDQWDSGGAVSVAAPVLMRLIAGKPLSPLTGDDDEWFDPDSNHDILQNIRCSSVFKNKDTGRAYDIADSSPGLRFISFPYYPARADVMPPVLQLRSNDG